MYTWARFRNTDLLADPMTSLTPVLQCWAANRHMPE